MLTGDSFEIFPEFVDFRKNLLMLLILLYPIKYFVN